ncbi:DUF547 domain-containing protein [bacterium]|nr:DUF547 domain-containing protein [bacterium]
MRLFQTSRFIILLILLAGSTCLAFDHEYTEYAGLLSKYVAQGRVDYAAILNDRQPLDNFLRECSEVAFDEYKTFSRARQICFLTNLYNASALALILSRYPVESIQDLGSLFTSPWNRKSVSLFNHKVGLGHIQHDILRPEFNEPRLHFAICSAARGGSHLLSEPYLPEKLEQQLVEAERDFMAARPEINFLSNGRLHLSQIFMWYPDDFGGKSGVLKFVQRFFPQVTSETEIIYNDFDWSLNSK